MVRATRTVSEHGPKLTSRVPGFGTHLARMPRKQLHARSHKVRPRWQRGNRMSREWPLWEVFIRSQHGLSHKHVGSLHAPDAALAHNNARDVYTRRNEGVSIWIVKSIDITSSTPGDKVPLFEPSE